MAISAKCFFIYTFIIINIFHTLPVPPEPSVQLLSGWTEVFLSEKVEFSCNVDGSSDWTFTWYRDEQQVQDSDPNVSIEGSKLTLTAASDAQSGSYSCKGHHKTKSSVMTGTAIPIKLKVHGKFRYVSSPIFVLNVQTACHVKYLKLSVFSPTSKQAQAQFNSRFKH